MIQQKKQFDQEFDVIVVGAGAAGLAAALTAIQSAEAEVARPTRVAILERSVRELRGGNTRWSGSFLRLENEVTPVHNLVEYGMSASKGYANREYYDALYEAVPEAFAWMQEHGVVLAQLPTIFPTLSAPRYQPVGGGKQIVEPLFAALEKTDAEVFYETAARKLLTDDSGAVVGVNVLDETGTARNLWAPSVILACGGFQADKELMTRYIGKNAYRVPPISRGGQNNRGDGLRMAMDVGAATEGQFDLFHAEPKDPRSDIAEAVVMTFPYGIVVNTSGKRFVDEASKTVDLTYETLAREIMMQDDSIAYAVFDQKVHEIPNYDYAVTTDVEPYTADTIDELEKLIGLPEGSLMRTVEEYNAACPAQDTFDWSVTDSLAAEPDGQPRKSNWSRPLTQGPFFAYPQICANVFTFGGVKTDTEARVVTSDGHVIPGLYGAGEMTGLYYEAYAGSTSVMRSITFGRIAGRNAISRTAIQGNTISKGQEVA